MRSTLGIALMALALSGCTALNYYGQAVSGQLQLLGARRPLPEVLADDATAPELRQRLQTAQVMRTFASTELALPDNGSYRSYADLQRPYVVWNVFATPELSLELREWCFPLVGCVTYRGYFQADAAERLAEALRRRNDDVYVAGVPAYSTLGWFDDPLLNTFVHWPSGRLAELVFHELAHQRLYVPGDTTFNESFATFVGRQGACLWLARYGTSQERDAYAAHLRQQRTVLELVSAVRDEIRALYASDLADDVKRDGKRRLLAELEARYRALRQDWGDDRPYDRWFSQGLNNAKLAVLNAYTLYLPAFEALFESVGGDFAAFYRAVETIAGLPPETRTARLHALMAGREAAVAAGSSLSTAPEISRRP